MAPSPTAKTPSSAKRRGDRWRDNGNESGLNMPVMATTPRTGSRVSRLANSKGAKIRPEADPCPDLDRLGSFPPPTATSEQLAIDNLKLATAMANRLARRTRMPFDDLHMVAVRGLLNGCRRYDPSTGNRLSTCVVPFIRGAMAQWLRDKGHSSGVRFPDRWRDKAPVVRRMAADGATLSAVVEATGLEAAEVEEILEAQGATRSLDHESYQAEREGRHDYEPDPWDEIEAYDELNDALRIADEAHAALRWADRLMLEQAWEMRPRRQLARMPHGQFLRHAEGIIRGERLKPHEEPEPPSLMVPVAGATDGARRRITEPQEILQAAEQLGLFDACLDGGQP
jgi:DNA-directed RNA polymerase specialized sigma subunit